jgi:site-specific DNA recombinase
MSKQQEQKQASPKSLYEDREGLVYARVSSKKQEIEGTGLQSQEGRCIDDLNSIAVPYRRTFPDSYTGGGDFMNRPAMREMLSYIDKNAHKKYVVVFDDLKRFARDVEFHLKLRATFRAYDVELRCLNYKFDESAEGRFVETILAAGNELERHQNKRQVVQKMKARLEAGYWSFGTKKGYRMQKDAMHGKISVPNGIEAKLLTEALEGFSTGIFVRPIDACQFLVENKFWKQSAQKYVSAFIKMLKDPFYAGYIEYPDWEVARRLGHHQSIISIQTFECNQQRLEGKRSIKRVRKDVSDDFPLRGLLNCGECEKHLTAAWTKGNGGAYGFYFCQNKKCVSFRKSINKDDIEKKFKKLLLENILKIETENLLAAVFDKAWEEEQTNFEVSEKEKLQRRKILEERIARLTEFVINAKSDTLRDTYERQIEREASKLEEIEVGTLEEIDLSIPYQTALEKSSTMLKSPYKVWTVVDTAEKQKLFFFIFEEKLSYSKIGGYQTDKVPTAIKLFEEFATPAANDVDPTGLEPATPSLQMRCSTR